MSIYITQIPPMNNIRFVPYTDAFTSVNARYNFIHWDARLFLDTSQDWQLKKNYQIKRQLNDRITVQVHTQNNSGNDTITHPPTLKLYRCSDNALIVNLNSTSAYIGSQVFTGNIDQETGTQLDTHLWSARATTLTSGAGGVYQLILETYDNAGTVQDKKISEPIFIKTTHKNTILIESVITQNHQNIIIDNWQVDGKPYFPYWGKRVEGDIREVMSSANLVDYKGISQNQYQLSAVVWETHTLRISGKTRVPNYEIINVAHAICADFFAIDGYGYKYVNENSQSSSGSTNLMKVDGVATSLFQGATVPIRRDTIENSYTTRGSKLLLFTSPGGGTPVYPFAFPYLTMSRYMLSSITLLGAMVIDSGADIAPTLATLNGAAADTNDLAGSFTYDSGTGNWYYNNAAGEFYRFSTCPIYTRHFDITVAIGAINTTFSFSYINGHNVIDFGDTTVEVEDYATTGYKTVSHEYATTGNKILRIFSDDNMTSLRFNSSSANAYISQEAGQISSAITDFMIGPTNDFSSHTDIDPGFLDYAGTAGGDGLTSLQLLSCGIKAFSPDIFTTSGFSNISYIEFGGNKLSSTQVDDIFGNLASFMTLISAPYAPRYINTAMQAPAAPPTGASGTARAYLTSIGFTITTD